MSLRTRQLASIACIALGLSACVYGEGRGDPSSDGVTSGLPQGVEVVQTGADTYSFRSPELPAGPAAQEEPAAQPMQTRALPPLQDFHLVLDQTRVKSQGSWGACEVRK